MKPKIRTLGQTLKMVHKDSLEVCFKEIRPTDPKLEVYMTIQGWKNLGEPETLVVTISKDLSSVSSNS